jgi:hypothetical protein
VNPRSETDISVGRSSRLSSVVRTVQKWASRVRHSDYHPQQQSENDGVIQTETIAVTAVVPRGRDCDLLRQITALQEWNLSIAHDWPAGLRLILSRKGGVVLIDRRLIDPNWKDLLELLVLPRATFCVVLIAQQSDDAFWEEVIRLGGYDVLKTPLDEARATETIEYAWLFWKGCIAHMHRQQ